MNEEPEITCSTCGKTYQPHLASGLGESCPHCLAQMLERETVLSETETVAQLAVGDVIGGVEILEPVASGAMGVVYKGRQLKLNRVVAVKVINAKLADIPEFHKRFEREARALAMLNHPHVVQVFDSGMEGDLCFLIMEWVEGTSLRAVLTSGHLSPDDALRYVPQICDALEYAHAQGVVHRDIKPENILLTREGQLKIADFGIARLRTENGTSTDFATHAGQIMGTPQYMAPEQQKHTDRVDHRADIYSLGVVFYEMLTGELPLGRFPSPSQRVKVDVSLDEVVLKTLEQDPNQRYQRASEIKQALTATATATAPIGLGAAADPVAPPEAKPRVTSFAWWSLAFALLSLIVLWEMTRAWFVDPAELDRPFFRGEVFTYVLRPLSTASALLAWLFGGLALLRVRSGQGRLRGRWLALVSMLIPILLLTLLLVGQVVPITVRVFVDHDLVALGWTAAFAVPLGLGLWFLFRKLSRFASDKETAAPRRWMLAAPLCLLLFGGLAWVLSTQYGKARSLHEKLYEAMSTHDHRPGDAEAFQMPDRGDVDLWLRTYTNDIRRLERNFFGHHFQERLVHLLRFEYERKGEEVRGWMPPSRHRIYFDGRVGGKFRDWHSYLWIHDFEIRDGLLEVEYEFPTEVNWDSPEKSRESPEKLALKVTLIRDKYGVEPNTLYRAELPLQDLKRYSSHGMDQEFWQSAELVESP